MPNGYIVISSREIGFRYTLLWPHTCTYFIIYLGQYTFTFLSVLIWIKSFHRRFSCNVIVEKLSYCQGCNTVIGSQINPHPFKTGGCIRSACTHTQIHANTPSTTYTKKGSKPGTLNIRWRVTQEVSGSERQLLQPQGLNQKTSLILGDFNTPSHQKHPFWLSLHILLTKRWIEPVSFCLPQNKMIISALLSGWGHGWRKSEEAQGSFTQKVVTFNDGPVITITICSNFIYQSVHYKWLLKLNKAVMQVYVWSIKEDMTVACSTKSVTSLLTQWL